MGEQVFTLCLGVMFARPSAASMLQEPCFQRTVTRALTSSDGITPTMLQQYAQWQWIGDDDLPHDYTAEVNAMIETAYIRFQEDMIKKAGGEVGCTESPTLLSAGAGVGAGTGAGAGAGAGASAGAVERRQYGTQVSSVVLSLHPHRVVRIQRMCEVDIATGRRTKVVRNVHMEYVCVSSLRHVSGWL